MKEHSTFSLVILAAGLGSRFGGNKPLASFGPHNVSLLELNIFNAYQAGCRHAILIIAPDTQPLFDTQLSGKFPSDITIEYAEQHLDDQPNNQILSSRIKPLGTAHALWSCRHLIDNRFVVTNGDDYYGANALNTAASHFRKQPNQWAIVGYDVDKTLSDFGGVNRGLCHLHSDGSLQSVTECYNIKKYDDNIVGDLATQQTTLEPSQLVSMNFWCLTPDIFETLSLFLEQFMTGADKEEECHLPDVIANTLQHQKIAVYRSKNQWFGLTYPDDKHWVSKQLDQLRAKEKAFFLQN